MIMRTASAMSRQDTLLFTLGTLLSAILKNDHLLLPTATALTCPADKAAEDELLSSLNDILSTPSPPTPTTSQDQSSSSSNCALSGTTSDEPAGGCPNGLWSFNLCICQCIAPFCASDQGQSCAISGACVQTSNHWENCQSDDVDCPYWRSITAHNSCATGPDVPAGIYKLYHTNQECCDAEFPEWNACMSNAEAEYVLQDIEYPSAPTNIVPIKFSMDDLDLQQSDGGGDVNRDEFNAEMLDILNQVLNDLDEQCNGQLDISGVEENEVRAMQVEEDIGLDEFYYNINLGEDVSGEELSSITETIFEGLQESKEVISEHIEAEVDNLETFDYNVTVDPDAWKIEEKVEEKIEVKIEPKYSLEKYRVKIRLEDLPPKDLDYEMLKQHVMLVYQSLLQNESKKVNELDVISLEGGGGNIYKQGDDADERFSTTTRVVVFRMDVVAMLDVENGRAALASTLSNEGFKNNVLVEIQSYTDNLSTNFEYLDWCTVNKAEDDVHAYSAVCPSRSKSASSSWKLPFWAVITLSVLMILLCCCLWFVTVVRIPPNNKGRQPQKMRKDVTGLLY